MGEGGRSANGQGDSAEDGIQNREKFATQVDARLLAEIRALARDEGRQLQALIDEALADLIEKRRRSRPRDRVMAAYMTSHETFAPLYRKLVE